MRQGWAVVLAMTSGSVDIEFIWNNHLTKAGRQLLGSDIHIDGITAAWGTNQDGIVK